LDTVDDGIEKYLFTVLKNSNFEIPINSSSMKSFENFEWDFFVAHFLG
jgi:hypothetical protein